MKIKTTIHIHYSRWAWEETGTYQVFSAKLDDAEHRVYVGEQEIEIDVPDKFDPRTMMFAALQRQRGKVLA